MVNNYFAGYTFHHAARQQSVRQRWPQRIPRAGAGAVGSGGGQELPYLGEDIAAVPVGVFQRSESHQLRIADGHQHEFSVRNHPHHLSGAADPVRAEAAVLSSPRHNSEIPEQARLGELNRIAPACLLAFRNLFRICSFIDLHQPG